MWEGKGVCDFGFWILLNFFTMGKMTEEEFNRRLKMFALSIVRLTHDF
jgi:hypothetical protein